MGKAVKTVTKPIAKAAKVVFPVQYVANKGLDYIRKGKNPLSGLTKEYSEVLGGGGNPDDPNAAMNDLAAAQMAERMAAQERMAAMIGRTREQAPIDRKKITDFGEGEVSRATASNAEIMNMRRERRKELANLLTKQADESFQLSQPEIAEAANSAGILASSGYGEALAKEKARLATDRENKLAEAALTDVDQDISGIQGVENLGRGYRDSGMSREFSLEDFAREGEVSKEVAAMQTPSSVPTPQVGGGGGKGGLLSGAMGGAAAGSSFGPWGALIGGGAGALLGNSQKKGK